MNRKRPKNKPTITDRKQGARQARASYKKKTGHSADKAYSSKRGQPEQTYAAAATITVDAEKKAQSAADKRAKRRRAYKK
ncbi:MAG: hypothetical protein GVY11_01265 [Gammaproteobacteria bacterium]|jgi:hypothetical protein|nr:hypothetical protein [Gammaproteobacteria bacterium]